MRANERSERPIGPLKTRLSLTRNVLSVLDSQYNLKFLVGLGEMLVGCQEYVLACLSQHYHPEYPLRVPPPVIFYLPSIHGSPFLFFLVKASIEVAVSKAVAMARAPIWQHQRLWQWKGLQCGSIKDSGSGKGYNMAASKIVAMARAIIWQHKRQRQ